jgi:hypothetical protein
MNTLQIVGAAVLIVGALVMAAGVGMTVKVSRGDTHLETTAVPGSAASWKATIAVGAFLMAVGLAVMLFGVLRATNTAAPSAVVTPLGPGPATPAATSQPTNPAPSPVGTGAPSDDRPQPLTPEATATAGGPSGPVIAVRSHNPPASKSAPALPPPSVCVSSTAPCRAGEDPAMWAVETAEPNQGICMISADLPNAGGQQTGVDGTCHASDAQFRIYRGSVASTVQFESATFPGTCLITPNGYDTFLRPCDSGDPKQWFVIPQSGTAGLIHPYDSSECLTGQGSGALYFATCGVIASATWQSWQIHTW